MVCVCAQSVQLFATPWNVAPQAPLSTDVSRQVYGVGCRILSKGSTRPSDLTCISCIFCPASGCFTTIPPGKPFTAYGILVLRRQVEIMPFAVEAQSPNH